MYNNTRGTSPHDDYPRVDGDFIGTTDEIIQWAACKHGVDEDMVRAQMALESWWYQETGGDLTSNQSECHPDLRGGSEQCPESIGLGQVRFLYHGGAFEDSNATRSTAYNVDYTYDVWRYDGRLIWLNGVERGRQYAAGDALGCMGLWFAGRWYTSGATGYMDRFQGYIDVRIWESPGFLAG